MTHTQPYAVYAPQELPVSRYIPLHNRSESSPHTLRVQIAISVFTGHCIIIIFSSCCLKLSVQSLFISRSPNLAAKLWINWLTWTWRTKIQFWRFPRLWKDRELHLMTGTLPVLVSLMMTISVCQDRGALMRHIVMILPQPAPIPRGTVKMVTSTQNP